MIIERGMPTVVLILLIIVSSIMTAIGLNAYEPWITALIWTIGIIFFFICCIQNSSLNQIEIVSFLLSLTISIAYLYILTIGHDLRDPIVKTGDAFGFWNTAVKYWNGDFSARYTVMPYILNFEFHIFDKNYLCCLLFNVLFCETATFILLQYANRKYRGNTDVFIIAIICFFPYLFKLSTSLWREALYVIFIALSFYCFTQYIDSEKVSWLYVAVLFTVPVLIGHSGYFSIPLTYFVSSFLMNNTRTRKSVGAFLVELLFLLMFLRIVMNFNSIDYITRGSEGLEDFFVRLAGSDRESNAGSAYLVGLKASNWGQVFLYAPIRVIFFLFSPLPMNWRGVRDIGTFILDSLLHFLILYKSISIFIKGSIIKDVEVRRMKELRIIKWGVVCYLFTALIFAMGTNSAGTAIRHRDSLIPLELFVYINSKYVEKKIFL